MLENSKGLPATGSGFLEFDSPAPRDFHHQDLTWVCLKIGSRSALNILWTSSHLPMFNVFYCFENWQQLGTSSCFQCPFPIGWLINTRVWYVMLCHGLSFNGPFQQHHVPDSPCLNLEVFLCCGKRLGHMAQAGEAGQDTFGIPFPKQFDPLGISGISWNIMTYHEISWNIMRDHETLKYHEISLVKRWSEA